MNQYNDIINEMASLSFFAGEEIMKFYPNKIVSEKKDDFSPVTEADRASDKLICDRLEKKFPEILCISEESYKSKNLTKISDIFFLIDPLDGTKEFIEKNDEFTVNIALIINNKTELGVIYAPAKRELYYTNNEKKSYQLNLNSIQNDVKLENSKQMHVSNEKKYLISTTSRSHNNEKTDNYLKNYKIKDKIICGSSLKFCLIANGTADIYPRLGPTCEWDTAAGHAILNGAGGSLKKLNGDNFLYGKLDKDFLNPEFIATNF